MDLNTPKVMGILNVTPDSFYDGGRYLTAGDVLKQTEKMLLDGADFIDIGGYSSRPGATDISPDEEWTRLRPVLQSIRKEFPQAIISVDTFRAQIAHRAIQEGGDMINDISAGQLDADMFTTIAALEIPYIMMHMRGTPQTMSALTSYDNLLKEIIDYFQALLHRAHQISIKDTLIDPGFGFSKTVEQNFNLLSRLEQLRVLDRPMVIGLSRKSMIWKTLKSSPQESLNGTTTLNTIALIKGASIIRVHDVKEARETIQLIGQLALNRKE